MKSKIDIAFCFDEKMAYPAYVAIASLLDFKKNEKIHYDISCICSGESLTYEQELQALVEMRDAKSSITFYKAPEQFKHAFEIRDVTVSTYLRLLLHRILPHKDQIIYADVDVLFQDSLQEMWDTDISNALLAGVRGANNFESTWKVCKGYSYADELEGLRGKYINAGILLMNLKAIRDLNPDEQWIVMSQKNYHYQDQDILNITCKGKIEFLDLRYNVQAHLERKDFESYVNEGLYDRGQCENAWEHPAVLHYTGPKPWNNRGVNKGRVWWRYVESQEDIKRLFDKRRIPNRKTTGLLGKINRHLPF